MISDAFRGLGPCVHCGFCLQNCPTYRETHVEGDSPRGRILLMRGLAEGTLSIADPDLASHLDRCLGCRACEPVCPAGVEYGMALETARHMLSEVRSTPLVARVLNASMAEALVREPLLLAARLFRPLASAFSGKSQLGFLFGMLAATRPWSLEGEEKTGKSLGTPAPAAPQTADTAATSVALFKGCVMSGLFSHVHAATERTLVTNGFRLASAPAQVCCGALQAHAGQREKALELARKNVRAFADDRRSIIAVNSAGCGAMLKDYGKLLAGDPLEQEALALVSRVRDVSELLAEKGPRQGHSMQLRVAYDPPCHLHHAQGITDAPLAVLQAVPGIEKVVHADADMCCGSAGSYSFTQSALSRAVLNRKVSSILETKPDLVATGNPGCIMQIGAGLAAAGSTLSVVHPVEILDRSYARAGFYD